MEQNQAIEIYRSGIGEIWPAPRSMALASGIPLLADAHAAHSVTALIHDFRTAKRGRANGKFVVGFARAFCDPLLLYCVDPTIFCSFLLTSEVTERLRVEGRGGRSGVLCEDDTNVSVGCPNSEAEYVGIVFWTLRETLGACDLRVLTPVPFPPFLIIFDPLARAFSNPTLPWVLALRIVRWRRLDRFWVVTADTASWQWPACRRFRIPCRVPRQSGHREKQQRDDKN
jgi:hypothetical protein